MANNFQSQLGTEFRGSVPRPDRAAFDRNLAATLEGFRQQVGFGKEAVRSRSASAGLFRAGQTEEAIVREVLAPAEVGVARAVSQAELGFQQAELQAFATASGLDLQQFGIEAGLEAAREARKAQETAALGQAVGTAAGIATGFLF